MRVRVFVLVPERLYAPRRGTAEVMEVETLQEGRIQKMESKNDEKYQKELESIASKQVSPVSDATVYS